MFCLCISKSLGYFVYHNESFKASLAMKWQKLTGIKNENAEAYELSVPSDDFSITMSQTPINNGLNELQSKFKKANAEKH